MVQGVMVSSHHFKSAADQARVRYSSCADLIFEPDNTEEGY
jgi:hypothetical protein